MSDQPIPTPADVAPKASEPAKADPTTEPAAAAPATDTPPWGEDFDPEKAWSLVQNLRADKERLQKRPGLSDEQKQKLAEYDRLAEASKTELERAQEAAKRNGEQAQALLTRAVSAEVKALAGEFADPSDAAAFLDLKKYATESNDIDTDAIKADLADLLARKPHLGKQPTPRVPAPNPAQGSSGAGPTGTRQLTRDDMSRMTPAEIDKATREGQFAQLLGQK